MSEKPIVLALRTDAFISWHTYTNSTSSIVPFIEKRKKRSESLEIKNKDFIQKNFCKSLNFEKRKAFFSFIKILLNFSAAIKVVFNNHNKNAKIGVF